MSLSEVYRLEPFQEAVGNLTNLSSEDGILIAEISRIRLALPPEMESVLRPHLGQRIAILKTYILNKLYLLRVLTLGADEI
jgi:hypothetical protein